MPHAKPTPPTPLLRSPSGGCYRPSGDRRVEIDRATCAQMLAALEHLVEHVGAGQYVSRSNLAEALAAIAKARGVS